MKHKLLLILLFLLIIGACYAIKASAQTQTAYQVADINPGAGAGHPTRMLVYNGKLYFTANDGTTNTELWSCDGTNTVLVSDICAGTGSSQPKDFVLHNNLLYFGADDYAGQNGLWSHDGTNTVFVIAMETGWLTSYNGNLYCMGADQTVGIELFRYNGSTYSSVTDINPGMGLFWPTHLAVYGDKLYFGANDGSGIWTELWSYDGTTAVLASDVNIDGSAAPENLIPLETANGEILVFAANSPNLPNSTDNLGRELYKYDPINGSSLAADICPGTCIGMGQGKQAMVVYNGKLYFGAHNQGNNGGLYSYDGITSTLVDNNYTDYGSLGVANGLLYYPANDGIHGAELWSFDGTNTTFVADVNPGAGDSNPADLTAFDNTLYFRANDGVTGNELWRLDNTVSISEAAKNQNAKIYSGQQSITVDATALTEQSTLVVFSMDGKQLIHATIEPSKITIIPMSNIAESIVAATIYNNTYSLTQKLLITK